MTLRPAHCRSQQLSTNARAEQYQRLIFRCGTSRDLFVSSDGHSDVIRMSRKWLLWWNEMKWPPDSLSWESEPMYRQHFSGVTVHTNVEYPIQVLPNVLWLDCLSEEVLHFVPKVFDGVHVRTLCEVHGQFVNNTQLSHATENNFNSAQKHVTWPPGSSLTWLLDRTTSLSLLTARLLTAWNFSQSFAVIQDVWDANNDSKSFIDVVIRCCQENKKRWAGPKVTTWITKAGHVCSKFERVGLQTRMQTGRVRWIACFWAVLYLFDQLSFTQLQHCVCALAIESHPSRARN